MILRRLSANFGVLDHETLELTPGLNVIEAPNESGKSTWCAFVRVMLYGPGPARGGKNGTKSDRELYAPWNGSPMEGTAEISWEGKEITLRRTAGPSGPLRAFSAAYTDTNRTVSALTESDAGEILTGLGAEVFARTAFIGSSGLRVAPGPELEKYIAASIASGEEGVSYTEAAARLRSWQRRLRYRDQGRIPAQETELRQAENDLKTLRELETEMEQTERQEERAAAAYSELTDRIGTMTQERSLVGREREEESLRLREEILRREREAETIRASLRASPLAGEEPGEALTERARADSRRAARLLRETRVKPPRRWILWLILAALCAVGAAFRTILLLPVAIALGLGIAVFLTEEKERRRRSGRAAELAVIRRRYGTAVPREILSAARSYIEQDREMRTLTAAARELRSRAEARPETGATSETVDAGTFAASAEELRAVSAKKARLLARIDALPDRETLSERIDGLRTALDRDERTFAALSAALSELTAADEEMQARSAPALSRRTGRYFRALTGERYDQLTLDRDLSAAARRTGDSMPHTDAWLSRGTRDQLYLAMRLALCEDSDCPLILDDALVSFDDERMGFALDVLRELSATRQILLFTCQSRERRYLDAGDRH